MTKHRDVLLRTVLPAAALIALTLWTYRHTPENPFHYDDVSNIVEKDAIHAADLSPETLGKAVREAHLPRRILPNLTFALDWYRGGGSPRPFQVTNLAIHTLSVLAVFALLLLVLERWSGRRDGASAMAAFAGAALWAVHPIQLQAVTYIVQRMASLAALFTVLAVWAYLRGRLASGRWRRVAWFAAAMVSLGLGAVSKENAWIGPVLVLLAEFGVVRHRETAGIRRWAWLWAGIPAAAVLLVVVDYAAGTGIVQGVVDGYRSRNFTMTERVLTQPRVIWFHLGQILWPAPGRFSVVHDVPVSTSLFRPLSTLWSALAGAAACAAGLAWFVGRRYRMAGFLMLWVPVALVVESTIVPLEMVYEHRMVLPGVGLAGLFSLAVLALWTRTGTTGRIGILAAVAVIVAALSMATAVRSLVWRDPQMLWSDAVAKYPSSAVAHNNLGWLYHQRGDDAAALRHYEAAVKGDPTYARAVLNLARAYRDAGRSTEAMEQFRRAAPLMPGYPPLHYSLGMLYMQSGDYARAAEQFETTLRLDPSHQPARMFLDYVRRQQGVRQ